MRPRKGSLTIAVAPGKRRVNVKPGNSTAGSLEPPAAVPLLPPTLAGLPAPPVPPVATAIELAPPLPVPAWLAPALPVIGGAVAPEQPNPRHSALGARD